MSNARLLDRQIGLLEYLTSAEGIFAERPGRDLTVHDLGGDVGIVGRGLTPADGAVIAADTDKTNMLVGKGFDCFDFHSC